MSANATAQTVSDQIDGIDGNGSQLPWRKVAMLFDSHLFGLPKDYAFPESGNVSSSEVDQITTLAKILTRKRKMVDNNSYDVHDAVFTILKYVLKQDPHINDDEPLSVNHRP